MNINWYLNCSTQSQSLELCLCYIYFVYCNFNLLICSHLSWQALSENWKHLDSIEINRTHSYRTLYINLIIKQGAQFDLFVLLCCLESACIWLTITGAIRKEKFRSIFLRIWYYFVISRLVSLIHLKNAVSY